MMHAAAALLRAADGASLGGARGADAVPALESLPVRRNYRDLIAGTRGSKRVATPTGFEPVLPA